MLDRIVGKKVVGIKQCTKAIKNGNGKVLYVAKDVDGKLIAPLLELVHERDIHVEKIETIRKNVWNRSRMFSNINPIRYVLSFYI